MIGDNVAKKKTGRRTKSDETTGAVMGTEAERRARIALDIEYTRVAFVERALSVGRDGGFNMQKWTPYVLAKAGYAPADSEGFYPSGHTTPHPPVAEPTADETAVNEETAAASI